MKQTNPQTCPPIRTRRPAPDTSAARTAHPTRRTGEEERQLLLLLVIAVAALLLTVLAFVAVRNVAFRATEPNAPAGDDIPELPAETGDSITTPGSHPFADGAVGDVSIPFAGGSKIIDAGSIYSQRAALADLSSGKVIASRLADERMYPASMTKVMTLIVAVENLPENVSLEHPVVISQATYDAMYRAGASGIGLEPGEQLTVEALLYLTILSSDGIAATELARYIAGTEAEFVSLMNRKVSSMGLEHTHFSNPTGLQDEANYTTCRDMAAILAYAMDMSLCRRVLTATTYNASCTADSGKTFTYYAANYLLTTLMNKYPGNEPRSLTITAGKTGYAGTNSGYCLATYAVDTTGHAYICVTSQAKAGSNLNGYAAVLRDHKWIYDQYAN